MFVFVIVSDSQYTALRVYINYHMPVYCIVIYPNGLGRYNLRQGRRYRGRNNTPVELVTGVM